MTLLQLSFLLSKVGPQCVNAESTQIGTKERVRVVPAGNLNLQVMLENYISANLVLVNQT